MQNSKCERPGMVLIVVLVAIMMLTLAGLTFAQLMFAEREAAWAHGRSVQTRALVDSGVAWIEQQVATPGAIEQAGGYYNNPAIFGPQLVVADAVARDRGRFCVVAPAMQAGIINGVRYGLEDESARLNLNTLLLCDPTWQSMAAETVGASTSQSGTSATGSQTAATAQTASTASSASTAQSAATASSGSSSTSGTSSSTSSSTQVTAQQALLGLPGMTPQIADSILDWLDPDDVPRPYGAERESYTSRGYAPKNGPFETVDELLLVNGVTPQLLYGQDIDRNGNIDFNEAKINISMPMSTGSSMSGGSSMGGASSTSGGSSTGGGTSSSSSSSNAAGMLASASMTQGWSAYLTAYSHESNLQPNGQPKINVNALDLQQLHQAIAAVLGNDVATFVIGYRQGKSVTGSQTTVGVSGKTPDFTKPGNTLLASPLDLVGCKVQASFQGDQTPSVINSPYDSTPQVMMSYIPMLLEYLTIVPSTTVPGRVNINHAPLTVLMTIPGMDVNTASMILSAQQASSGMLGSNRNYPTWLYTEGLVSLDTMKKLMPFITCGGRVYRAQVVGYFESGGPVSRAEVVIDATTNAPRLLLWRELSHLGPGYSRRVLGF